MSWELPTRSRTRWILFLSWPASMKPVRSELPTWNVPRSTGPPESSQRAKSSEPGPSTHVWGRPLATLSFRISASLTAKKCRNTSRFRGSRPSTILR